jgi:hypothetical protein
VLICQSADFSGADFGEHCVIERGEPDRRSAHADANPLALLYPPRHTFTELTKDDHAQWLPVDSRIHMSGRLLQLRWRFERTKSALLRTANPRIKSLQRANVAGLSLFRVSLAECRLTTARGLDQLRIDNLDAFGTSHNLAPRAASHVPAPLWTSRAVLFEEGVVRGKRDDYDPDERVNPHLVAGAYRELRKSFEDAKNEPGAADFYYGEMEMRRRGRQLFSVERALISAYWLLSGYGLRAWRALAVLVALFASAAFLLSVGDYATTNAQPPHALDYKEALVFLVRDATVLLRPAGPATVTTHGLGTALDLVIRIATPVLFALVALAIRARVKR